MRKLEAWCQFTSATATPDADEPTPAERDAMKQAMDEAVTVLGEKFREDWHLLGDLPYHSKIGKAYFKLVVDLQEKCPRDIAITKLLGPEALPGGQKKKSTTGTAPEPPQTAAPPSDAAATAAPPGEKSKPQAPPKAAGVPTNADQKTQSAANAAPAPATEEPPSPPTGGPGKTTYFGDKPTQNLPPATMNPDALTSTPVKPPTVEATPVIVATPEEDPVDTCGNAINAELSANRIYFGSGRYDLARASLITLKKIAQVAKQCGAVIIEVDGFTDNVGPPAYNKMLSEGRAEAVVDFLVAAGVEAAKLRAVGFGQERPITTNNTREGRRLNRRIEFSVSSK